MRVDKSFNTELAEVTEVTEKGGENIRENLELARPASEN
jgi:hypothetical protein